jgi:hypothetical protein
LFNRKQPQVVEQDDVPHADLIDLLLDADDNTRDHLMLQVLESGDLKRSEADALMAYVLRLERVAGPRTPRKAARTDEEPQAAWGIDYP